MGELLKGLIEYIGDDYTEEQNPFLLMLLEDAADEVCEVLYPYGFTSDEETAKARNMPLRDMEARYEKSHNSIMINKEKRA